MKPVTLASGRARFDTTPLATWLLHETGTPYSISIYLVLAAAITLLCVAALPDRSRSDITDDATYATRGS